MMIVRHINSSSIRGIVQQQRNSLRDRGTAYLGAERRTGDRSDPSHRYRESSDGPSGDRVGHDNSGPTLSDARGARYMLPEGPDSLIALRVPS